MSEGKEPTVQQLFSLEGKTALITGGTGYLGRAMSYALAEAGAKVVIASRSLERAEEFAKELPGTEGHCGLMLDHNDEDSIPTAMQNLKDKIGYVDVLVNNAHSPSGKDLRDVSYENFQNHFSNAAGYFVLAREMRNWAVKEDKRCSIVMITSMYGMVGGYPEDFKKLAQATPVAYHTLKGGLLQMTRHLATFWAKDNIRVNSLSPGPFPKDLSNQEFIEQYNKRVPMGRMGIPHELKGALILLASDAGSYMTGQNIVVDGGWTSW